MRIIKIAVFIPLLISGCAHQSDLTPHDDPSYQLGASVRQMIRLQTQPTPQQEIDLGIPLSGMDYQKAANGLREYRRDVAKPKATTSGNVTINVGQ